MPRTCVVARAAQLQRWSRGRILEMARISSFLANYVEIWVSFCLIAILILVKDLRRLRPEWRGYVGFLRVPWKRWLFLPALLFVSFAGQYTDDESWDLVTGSGMAILTFLTAPWSVGLGYQVLTGVRPVRYLVVAIPLLLFSSSWFYDANLLWRDGVYTPRWEGNLMLSPIIYIAAGLLWSLEPKTRSDFGDRSRIRLSFLRPDWPSRPEDTRFAPLLSVAIPLIVIAAFVLVAFVGWTFHFARP